MRRRGVPLRTIRDRLGLTQAQFGALLGVQGCTVCRWESTADPLHPTVFQVGLIHLFDAAGRAHPRTREANDIAYAIGSKGAAVALAGLLAEALRTAEGPCPL